MSEFTVVPRSAVPGPRTKGSAFPGKVYAELIDVLSDAALKVPVANYKSGLHLRKRLQQIADKEHLAKSVMFSRSKDGKEFFFWLEKES